MHAGTLAAPVTIAAPWLWMLPGLPLAAFTLLILFGRRIGRLSGWLAVAALAGSCAMTLSMAGDALALRRMSLTWAWLSTSNPSWLFALSVDGLSWIMLFVVTTIAPLIATYSIGYMHGDPRFSRFFAYFSLFCASMIGLVMAEHLVLLYACWELVGLCSYLLISFWFEKPEAAAAGRKAFLTTRVGDTGLLLGLLLLAWSGGSLQTHQLAAASHTLTPSLLTLISLLIFIGAAGKSAQVPLHVWLPDAMEGPTPVSALIHAATMVAAGVYLVARTAVLFTPQSLAVVLGIGLVTHLLAGTVALTQTDIKRILAYSTLSQLGLMMTALGIGAVSAAMFHLLTHAFFKALLFLGAGSVIHATHAQELSQLGGLRRAMPWTSTLFLIASLSMGGCFLLSGYWSKDAILLAAEVASPWLMGVLLVGAGMTAAYIFRLYLRCFHGPSHAGHHAPHDRAGHPAAGGVGDGSAAGREPAAESPMIMVLPMALLGLGAAAVGLVESPWLGHPFLRLLSDPHAHEHIDIPVTLLSAGALAAGIALAWIVGVRRRNPLPEAFHPLGRALYTLAFNKYYVDEAYERWIIRPAVALSQRLTQFDQRVIDGAVNGAGGAGDWVSRLQAAFDRTVVDGAVNGVAAVTRRCGLMVRRVQGGVVQQYLLIVVVAVVALTVAFGLSP